jgi:hypothetical protein
MQTVTAATIARRATATISAQFRMIEMGGYFPQGHEPVQARIIEARPTAIRVEQGAHRVWLPASAIFLERGQWARDLHEGARLYVPTNLVNESGLRPVGVEQIGRERAYIRRRNPSNAIGLVHIAQDIAPYMDADAATDAGRFDEALASCSFQSEEQIQLRAHDGRRYDVIALDPSEEATPAARAQIAAYALIEHFHDMMQEKEFVEIVRECKHWMARIESGEDGLEPQTREALTQIMVRARHAANAARHDQPYRDSRDTRAEELAALAKRRPRRV